MAYSKVVEIFVDICIRFCMAFYINIKYRNKINSWLDLEYACEEWYGNIFQWCENYYFHIFCVDYTPFYHEYPC